MLTMGTDSSLLPPSDSEGVSKSTLLVVKLVLLFANLFETALGALLPYCLQRSQHADKLMSVAAAGAAGVFLGVGVCHMSDSAFTFLQPLILKVNGFRLDLSLLCVGIALMLFLEKVASPHHHHHHHAHAPPATGEKQSLLLHGHDHVQEHDHDHNHDHDHDHEHKDKDKDGHRSKYIKAAAITLGLMIHGAVSGLTTGMMQDLATLGTLAIANVSHDWSHTSALVVLYSALGLGWRSMGLFLTVFVITEPLFIGIGIAVSSSLATSSAFIASGILCALASGVFIYISVGELLHEAFEEPHWHLLKFFVFSLAVAGLAVVAIFA
jgi:zinc transporter ZupT